MAIHFGNQNKKEINDIDKMSFIKEVSIKKEEDKNQINIGSKSYEIANIISNKLLSKIKEDLILK